jgi:hypothetical protein
MLLCYYLDLMEKCPVYYLHLVYYNKGTQISISPKQNQKFTNNRYLWENSRIYTVFTEENQSIKKTLSQKKKPKTKQKNLKYKTK